MSTLANTMSSFLKKGEYFFPSETPDEEKVFWIGFAISKIENDEAAMSLLHSLDWATKEKLLEQLGAFARERKKGKVA